MPSGWKNGPATFNHLVSLVLGSLRREKRCFYFFDDVLVNGKSFEQLMVTLREAVLSLRQAKLTLNPSKCRFGFQEVVFMGLVIEEGTVVPTEDKLQAIREFPTPTNATQVRQFLGLSGFFRRFIPRYAFVAAPLSALTSTETQFAWGNAHQNAFERLKTAMEGPPILRLFDAARPTELRARQ